MLWGAFQGPWGSFGGDLRSIWAFQGPLGSSGDDLGSSRPSEVAAEVPSTWIEVLMMLPFICSYRNKNESGYSRVIWGPLASVTVKIGATVASQADVNGHSTHSLAY